MPTDALIRPFAPQDLQRLHEIRTAAYTPVFKSFRDIVGPKIAAVALPNEEVQQGAFLDELCKADAKHDVFVVEDAGEIVGFCSVAYDLDLKLGEIDLNAVHPDAQGKGLGVLMYEHALALMRERGMRAATVGTGGDESHAPARAAYQKAGFGPAIPNVYLYRML
jgi:ribosomal protein S18 acetylase RimI-like enzyme